ncbi:disintegrin and metalloproteinase domain-containing protein 8-like [Solea senegalensis]|uniref:Disintegrin and metalloproteinase domain-containing protein 8-like n=1 Tax=Solea senegalensis TaxID=28829 RepID=A0AAV6S2F7_SOLSE|nr:disintegrin and metalloproteinase domain-containing protein 8-like [Solea senegalensis]
MDNLLLMGYDFFLSYSNKYPDTIQYSLTIERQNLTLHLERNIHLIGKNFSVMYHSDEGTQVTTNPDLGVHCYYHGHIVGVEASSASVRLCSGIKGILLLWDQTYLIEPLVSREAGQQEDTPSSHAHRDEGLHMVYNYKHLRRKRRSTCSHGNTTTFYGHGDYPSRLFQLSSLVKTQSHNIQYTYFLKQTQPPRHCSYLCVIQRSGAEAEDYMVRPMTVELVLVADHTEYMTFNSTDILRTRMLDIANHVDRLYHQLGFRVMLVGVYIWSYRDEIVVSSVANVTLKNFLAWRQRTLLPKIKHDNAQLITGVDFDGPTVGLAVTSTMCSLKSGGINQDNHNNFIVVAVTVAHEMGHNLGMNHDTNTCLCGGNRTETGCIMAARANPVPPHLFSSCSTREMDEFLQSYKPRCLLNTPSTDRIYGGPVCGNAFVEAGEQCDCGTERVCECTNRCCVAATCRLTEGAQCAEGECCENCQLKPTSSVCRPKARDCDMAENCTGFSATCPTDVYAQNGLLCGSGKGYCYDGQCPSKRQHCKKLWGPDAEVAPFACYYLYGNCQLTWFGQKCRRRKKYCGTLFCSGGNEFPVTKRKSMYTLTNGQECNEATKVPDFPEDVGNIPTGTKCGTNKVCYSKECQDFTTLKVYASSDCSHNCSNNGVCDDESKCHCNPGWLPPFCQEPRKEQPPMNMTVILVAGGIGLLLLVIIVVCCCCCCCCTDKRRPVKSQRVTFFGLFQPPNIPKTVVHQPSKIQQVVKPFMLPYPALSQLSYKEVMKPKPPMPPVKPPVKPLHSSLHCHTLSCQFGEGNWTYCL